MEVIKYPYSKTQIWFYMIAFLAILIFILVVFIVDFADHSTWPLLGMGGVFCGGALTYLYFKYFVHLQKGEIALELDKEKLQYFIGNKSFFWKDVLYANPVGNGRGNGMGVRFSLENGSDVVINTKFVGGNDEEIYNTVMSYFEKYKSV